MKAFTTSLSALVALTGTAILMGASANDPIFEAARAGSLCPSGEVCRHAGPAPYDAYGVRFGKSQRAWPVQAGSALSAGSVHPF